MVSMKKGPWAEYLFYSGYILYLIRSMAVTTMFPGVDRLEILIPVSALLFVAKIFLCDGFGKKEVMIAAVSVALVMIQLLSARGFLPVILILCIIAARGMDLKKCLRIYIVIVASFMFLAFTASKLGIIKDLIYEIWICWSKER